MNTVEFCSVNDEMMSHRVAGQHQEMRPRMENVPSPINCSSRTFLDGHPMTRAVEAHQRGYRISSNG